MQWNLHTSAGASALQTPCNAESALLTYLQTLVPSASRSMQMSVSTPQSIPLQRRLSLNIHAVCQGAACRGAGSQIRVTYHLTTSGSVSSKLRVRSVL